MRFGLKLRTTGGLTALRRRDRMLYFFWRLALPTAVAAALWAPHFSHYRIDRSPVSWQTLQESTSTRAPVPDVLEEIAAMALGVRLDLANHEIVSAAQQVLGGSLAVPRFLDGLLPLQGYPQDYRRGPATLQLVMASLEVERILLSAFEQTQDQRYLQLATRRILAFAAHEALQRQGQGFLWNDHAVAARISVLAKLWRHVRESPDFPAASSRAILSLVERSGRLLAKPSQFTVRTNHGVVQNLALLQIAAAFPALAENGAWRRLAEERLAVQLPFYVSSEGVVLEHSAEYHLFGTELLAMAVRLSVLNGLVPAPALVDAARKARLVLDRVVRPDGSLPLLGNTSAAKKSAMPVGASDGTAPVRHLLPPYPSPQSGVSLYPVAGYAVWWQADDLARPAQTLIAWAKHDGHGHKHADEGSVLFWSHGVDWLTNTGYWPYGWRHEDAAYSWTGSNAPHQPGEGMLVPRSVRLLATGDTAGVRFVEIERRNQDGAQFRRQVLQVDAATLLVMDFAQEVPNGTETVWTVDASLRLFPGATDSSFVSSPASDGRQLAISFATHTAARLELRRGSEHPFAGWVVVNDKPTPADALRIVDPATNSASAILFALASNPMEAARKIALKPGATADRWEVLLEQTGTAKRLSRSDSTLTLSHVAQADGRATTLSLPLLPAPDKALERAALKRAYLNAVTTYPPWRELYFYRVRLSYVLGVLALLVEVGWFAISKLTSGATKRQLLLAHVAMTVGWAAAAVWMFQIYLM